jgi:hypothetical protein
MQDLDTYIEQRFTVRIHISRRSETIGNEISEPGRIVVFHTADDLRIPWHDVERPYQGIHGIQKMASHEHDGHAGLFVFAPTWYGYNGRFALLKCMMGLFHGFDTFLEYTYHGPFHSWPLGFQLCRKPVLLADVPVID